jgi:phenylacetate-CoA ligase
MPRASRPAFRTRGDGLTRTHAISDPVRVRLSAFVDDAYARLYTKALMPLWEGVRQRATISLLAQLEATQWQRAEEIAALQFLYLKAMLERAGEHVPYYRELFAKIGFRPAAMQSRDELAQIPPLTKAIIRERYHDLIDPATAGKNLLKGTSGSTGQPLKFEYSTESEAWRQATRMRGYRWAGWEAGYKTWHYWGIGANTTGGLAGRKIDLDRGLKRERYVSSVDQTEGDMTRDALLLARERPRVLVCYTQAATRWARFIHERGLRDWPDIRVICGAEALLPADRAALSRAFGPHIFETYGARETMLVGAECDAHDGMHLSEENLFVENVDAQGRAVAPGVAGDLLVTDLHNHAMPLIRYTNGDIGVMAEPGACACGRSLAKILRVEGRRADYLLDPQGLPIQGMVFAVMFADARNDIAKQFQVTQRPDGHVHLRVVRGPDFTDAGFAKAMEKFGGFLRGLPFTFELVEHIAPQPNGKHKSVVRLPRG